MRGQCAAAAAAAARRREWRRGGVDIARKEKFRCGISRKSLALEVLEVDILWPRWVARIGVTRSTQAWFLTADRQCTELPLLRLPRLVPEVARG